MRRLSICLVCTALIACGGTHKSEGSGDASEREAKAFIDSFWESKQVAHYITTVDALIDRAVTDASADASASGQHKADTNNAVRVVISLTHRSDASVYHVSFSHRPYLASLLAKKFAGLVALRLGFAIPSKVMVSQNQVFHLEWSVPNSKEARDMLDAARKQLREETSTEDIANYVFLKTLEMEIAEFQAPTK